MVLIREGLLEGVTCLQLFFVRMKVGDGWEKPRPSQGPQSSFGKRITCLPCLPFEGLSRWDRELGYNRFRLALRELVGL